MTRTRESYYYEGMCMAKYIMEGHNEKQTADEFEVSKKTVRRRLKYVGHTYADLVEARDNQGKRIL